MLLSTLSSAPDGQTAEILGPVYATVVVGANVLKDVLAAIRDAIGGRARAYERTVADARAEAQEAAVAQARALGADALLGLRYDHFPLRDGMFIVSVQGTAVRLKPTV
jgi:uncharacterized protein YbjQ (UPF0145 family)